MTKRMEQTQNAKMVQLALYHEYGFQPCLKDIEILESVETPDFPWHLERAYVEIKGHFYTIYQNEFGGWFYYTLFFCLRQYVFSYFKHFSCTFFLYMLK